MSCWNLVELILQVIYFGICLTAFIWRLTKDEKGNIFFEFEMWGIMLQLVYYIIFLISGFTSIFNKSKEENQENQENKCLNFLKSVLFKYIWPLVLSSPIIFYLGYFSNWFYLQTGEGNDYALSLFLHGFSQFGFIIDIILFKREYKSTHFFDLLIITGIYVAYCFLLGTVKPEMNNYLFLSNDPAFRKGNSFLISLMIVCFFIYLYMYIIYMYIVRFKSGLVKLFGGDETKESMKEKKQPLMNEANIETSEENNIN